MNLDILACSNQDTWILNYLFEDPNSNARAIIDPLLDYDRAFGQTQTKSAEQVT